MKKLLLAGLAALLFGCQSPGPGDHAPGPVANTPAANAAGNAPPDTNPPSAKETIFVLGVDGID